MKLFSLKLYVVAFSKKLVSPILPLFSMKSKLVTNLFKVIFVPIELYSKVSKSLSVAKS